MLEWPSVGGLWAECRTKGKFTMWMPSQLHRMQWINRNVTYSLSNHSKQLPKMHAISIHFRILGANGMLAAQRSNSFSMNSADTNGANHIHKPNIPPNQVQSNRENEKKKNVSCSLLSFVRLFVRAFIVTSFYLWENDDFFFFPFFGRRLFQTGFRLLPHTKFENK